MADEKDNSPEPEPTFVEMLIDGLSGPNDALGRLLLGLCIREEVWNRGLSTDQITDVIATFYVEQVSNLEAEIAEDAAFEKALHKAARGDFETAGRLIREHLVNGAIAYKFIPIGIEKSKQAKEYGSRGAALNKEIGRGNRQKIQAAKEKFLADRTGPTTERQLAGLIATETGIKSETVRGHLKKMRNK